ncbi:MAG TPA: inositol monophosphatase [Candidatus Synoicihabitans sp.]|nr:inositol monophosphatase [Candidatus Synoicihabitans sp.]
MSQVSDYTLDERVAAARAAVLAQTDLLHREFGRAASQWKSDGSRVTAVDHAISEGIINHLRSQFPQDDYFSEELAEGGGPWTVAARYSWVLDPIDGTNNYANGLAHCAISLALCEGGQPVYGVIYDLARRKLIHGGPGRGVWDGDARAEVRSDPPHAQTLVAFHSPMETTRYPGHADAIVQNFKVRALGSSTLHLAYVAVGIIDGVVDHNVKIWDIAAAIPLVLAGGGEVQFIREAPVPLRQFDLKMPRIFFVAGNAAICRRLREVLKV